MSPGTTPPHLDFGRWIRMASSNLKEAGVDAATLEAQLLLARAAGKDRMFVLTHPDHPVPEVANELLVRRMRQEPLAYILGSREFFGRKFHVDASVLIPRMETEILIEKALEFPKQDARVLDIGTGSGCIACTLKLERPNWEVWASDVSNAAIQTARENAETLGAEIRFRHSNLFNQFLDERFDLVVSNPPYIGRNEELPIEIKDHEPDLALYADEDGLAIYRRIADLIPYHLNPGGWLVLEIGQSQGEAVQTMFPGSQVFPDLSGNDRVVVYQL